MTTKLFGKVLAVAGAVAVLTAACVSIYLNSPSAVKAHALDQKRLQALQQIDNAVRNYYRTHQALPERLDVIENNGLAAWWDWKDPVTHKPYEYDVLGKTSYRLCADFAADSGTPDSPYAPTFRKHLKGHDCFQQDVKGE